MNRFSPFRPTTCPCCGWRGHNFFPIDCGDFVVPAAWCPQCYTLERHRLLDRFLKRQPPRFLHADGAALLHITPDRQLRKFLQDFPHLKGVTIDCEIDYKFDPTRPRPDVQADLQRLPFADNSFDGAFCIHVLEHVPDDCKGIQELYRTLKPGGQAVIIVPFMSGLPATVEYGAPDPDMFDHVRGYSPDDFFQRLAPLEFTRITPLDVMSRQETRKFKVPIESEIIYLCSKPGTPIS